MADLKLTVTVSTATGSKEVHPIDSTSPNATYYTDFISTMLKEAQDTFILRSGTVPVRRSPLSGSEGNVRRMDGVGCFGSASPFASLN